MLLACGAALAAAGHWINAKPDRSLPPDWLWPAIGWPLRALLGDTVPSALPAAMMAIVMAALLIAAGIGWPAAPGALPQPALAAPARLPHLTPRRGLALLVALGGLLALGWSGPLRGVAIWAAGLALGGAAAWHLDRQRGTPLRNPLRAWEWALVAALVGGHLLWMSRDLADWHWAGTPDEGHFFGVARDIATGQNWRFALSEKGVFGYHPMLSSYYQAAFMWWRGPDAFGWRLSSAAALSLALGFVYLLGRELANRRTGLIAAALLGTAQLAVTFAHFGYNNAQVYPAVTACLAAAAWAVTCRSATGFYLAGALAGLGWFTYQPARLSLLLVLLLLWSMRQLAVRRGDRLPVMALLAGWALAALPLLLRPWRLVSNMLEQTMLHAQGAGPAGVADWLAAGLGVGLRIAQHWALSVLHVVWSRSSHFLEPPVVDPLTATLALVGLWLSLGALRQRGRAGFLFPAYVLSALCVGALSYYDYPPLTRLLFLAPFTALLAGLALDRLLSATLGAAPRLAALAAAALVGSAAWWNASAIHDRVYVQHHGYGDGTTSELIRFAQRLPAQWRVVYVQRSDTFMMDADTIMGQFHFGGRFTYARPFGPRAELALAQATPPTVVLYELINASDIALFESLVAARFPGVSWRETAPGKPWSLRYAMVPAGWPMGNETPAFPFEGQ